MCARIDPITYAPTFAVSMVTPCPPSVHMHIPPSLSGASQRLLFNLALFMFLVRFFCLHFTSCVFFCVFHCGALWDVCSDITYMLLIARQTCFHPHPTSTHLSGSICANLKSVTSIHQDGLRSFPSPRLSCTCMCGSLKGGHISRVSRG